MTSTPIPMTSSVVVVIDRGRLTCNDILCLLALSTTILPSIVSAIGMAEAEPPSLINMIALTLFAMFFSLPPIFLSTSIRFCTLGRLALGASLALLLAFIFVPDMQSVLLASTLFLPMALVAGVCVFVPLPL